MQIEPAVWLLIGFLVGTIFTSISFVLSNAMTHSTLKLLQQEEPDVTFEPEPPESEDIRISIEEDDEK